MKQQPWDPDPLHVPEQPVKPYRYDGNRPGITIPTVLAIAVIVGIVIALNLFGGSRSRPDGSPRPTASGASQVLSDVPGEDTPQTIGTRPASTGAAAGLNPPAATPRYTGTATWYCGNGSPCTQGYGPSDLVAAIDRKDTTFRKGDRVTVRYGDKAVTVRIVDTCACADKRVIDLTTGAFRRLAPLGLGVLPVTVELAGPSPTLPPTDEE